MKPASPVFVKNWDPASRLPRRAQSPRKWRTSTFVKSGDAHVEAAKNCVQQTEANNKRLRLAMRKMKTKSREQERELARRSRISSPKIIIRRIPSTMPAPAADNKPLDPNSAPLNQLTPAIPVTEAAPQNPPTVIPRPSPLPQLKFRSRMTKLWTTPPLSPMEKLIKNDLTGSSCPNSPLRRSTHGRSKFNSKSTRKRHLNTARRRSPSR